MKVKISKFSEKSLALVESELAMNFSLHKEEFLSCVSEGWALSGTNDGNHKMK